MPDASPLTLAVLREAVAGGAAALRLTLRLEAVSPKVFPPTYEGGKYATEDRRIDGQTVPCVLLDSVPSQANRMELALQDAVDGGEIELPVVSVDFSALNNPNVPKVTSLLAPHRLSDAILRDSLLAGKRFRDTDIGQSLNYVSPAHATPLLRYAPHCLVFGLWDSTGPRGGLGVKFARAVVSEVVGVNAVPGVTTASRIDPLSIVAKTGPVYHHKDEEGGWTRNIEEAKTDKKTKKPMLIGKDGKPSEINHGNVTPDLAYRRDKNGNIVMGDATRPVMMVVFDNEEERGHRYVIRDERLPLHKGGFTIDHAEQSTVVSLPALRRLRFPMAAGERSTPTGDAAARTYLAALGLLGATLAVESGYDLRSRCVLRATESVRWEVVGRPGEQSSYFDLTKADAAGLYREALAAVQQAGLPIHLETVRLDPLPRLVDMVKDSYKLKAAGGEEDE